MGERKVLNKYYPPDFDPAKIPRWRQLKHQPMKVRTMLPMSIRCGTCRTYIYKGTKFNSRKEAVVGETYLGIQIFRFYFKCSTCSAEITFKTDPQNSDYTVESGASRNFEPWRGEEEARETEKRKRAQEEMGDGMKALENRALDSKRDMDILAALEEMRSIKSRHATVSVHSMLLENLKQSAYEEEKKIMDELNEADEALIKSITFHSSKDFVRRIDDEDDDTIKATQNNLKRKSTSVLAKVEKPTVALTKATIHSNSKDAGNPGGSSMMPKFILKPRSTTVRPKKARTDCGTPKDKSDGGNTQTKDDAKEESAKDGC